jgi:glycerophosphoryl diester phosphodiesterase
MSLRYGGVRSAASAGPAWSSLPPAAVVPHRGGSLQVPEHTLEGYRIAVREGLPIECDVRTLSDGSLAVMHDDTVDRVTTSTGKVADHTALSWKTTLTMDSSVVLGGGWLDGQRPVLFEEVLAEFGNSVLITPEAKTTGSMGAIIDALERHGIHHRTVLLQSFSAADCDVAVRRGWDVVLLGSTDYIAAAAAGYEWIGPAHTSVTGSLVSGAHAAGVKVACYTVDLRVDYDRVAAAGIDAVFSDDPVYLARTFTRTTDRFASQTWLPGFQSTFVRRGRGRFYSGGAWGMDLVDSSADWALHGYLTPPDGAAFTLDYTLQIDALNAGDTSRWHGLWLGTTDWPWRDQSAARDLPCLRGYHLLVRGNGDLQIYRYDGSNGVKGLLATAASGVPVTVGKAFGVRVTVTGTTIAMQKTSGGDVIGTPVTATESNHRPLTAIVFGRCGVGFRVCGVSVE